MHASDSPWLHQLQRTRPVQTLTADRTVDVAIVGAGIAGISTAYFVLKYTKLNVLLIEGDKVAHGATGHNAGQIVSYFERQVSDLVEEFGLAHTAQAQYAIDSTWSLLDEIYIDTDISTPFEQFTGYAGCQDIHEVLLHLQNAKFCRESNITVEPMVIAEGAAILSQIPNEYADLYSIAPHEHILKRLQTNDKAYIALISARKGCMNSALFCEDLLSFMQKKYANRLSLVEESPMDTLVLQSDSAEIKIKEKTVHAKKVVLCTNGFEKFTILNKGSDDINTKFHHLVRGTVGYMAAYIESQTRPATAVSYLPKRSETGNDSFDDHPYFYLTRRTFTLESKTHSLICIGGPETKMDDTNNYKKEHPYPDEAQAAIDEFLHTTYAHAPKEKIDYEYKWHGLMGYTPNGVRCIGPEPQNPVLLYNLGCNGIGILPSIYGGKKISRFLAGEKLEPSIFDPKLHDPEEMSSDPKIVQWLYTWVKRIVTTG